MDPLQALVLGIVQGLAEFLPISSSAHLIILPWLFQWKDPGLSFDIALHTGTLIAVVAYFWRDWADLLGGFLRTITGRRTANDQNARLFWLVVLASIPGAIAGAAGESAAESWLRAPLIIASLTIGLGVLLFLADGLGTRARLIKHLSIGDATSIGLAQALAICPGVSRSGITITAGLLRGLTREAAVRFSFLMSTPIVAGAALLNVRNMIKDGVPADERWPFVIGVLAAAFVGFFAIKLLLRYVLRNNLRVFAYYRFAFGLLIIVAVLFGR